MTQTYCSLIFLKLGFNDTLKLGNTTIGGRVTKSLKVNDEIIYFLHQREGADRPLYQISRTVFGTLLKIPSEYPQRHRFEGGRYIESRGIDQ